MAKRPTTPRPRSAPRRPASTPTSASTAKPAERTARTTTPRSAPSPATRTPSGSDRTTPGTSESSPRTRSRGRPVGRSGHGSAATHPVPGRERVEQFSSDAEQGRVVQATERFRSLVAGRPWRRRRRAILGAVLAAVLVLGAALSAAIWLPALQLQQVTVSGLGYVEEEPVRSPVEAHIGDSVLLLPSSAMEQELSQVPGVRSAEVERSWPDGAHVTITEAEPSATLTRSDGSTAIIDADGAELPAAAGEGATLVPLTVDAGSGDPDGAAEAMVEVLAEFPDALRDAVADITATSRSDVTVTLDLEDGGTKTVVWGDSQDAELKAEVVQTLIGQPGDVIDVSSPVAPVTR